MHVERTDLSLLVNGMAEEYRAAAGAKHLALTVDVEPHLPVVRTDPSRVRQIIGNFLSNAVKYTRSGSITLCAHCRAATEHGEGPCIFVEVIDTGPGIPADERELIFEEFHRIVGTGQPGAGLGLAISARVADALGCRIRVHSEVGMGSTFTLCIPVSGGGTGRDQVPGWSVVPEDRSWSVLSPNERGPRPKTRPRRCPLE